MSDYQEIQLNIWVRLFLNTNIIGHNPIGQHLPVGYEAFFSED